MEGGLPDAPRIVVVGTGAAERSTLGGEPARVESTDPKAHAMATIKLRCIEGLSLGVIPVHHCNSKVACMGLGQGRAAPPGGTMAP